MKYSLECVVDSKIRIPKIFSHKIGRKEFIFIPSEDGLLDKIKIIVDVEKPDKFYSKVKKVDSKKVDWTITINRDRKIYQELIEDFQQLESQLAFDFPLKRIMWNSPKEEILPETEDEKRLVGISGLKYEKNYPDQIKCLDEQNFKTIVEEKDKYSGLTIPMAFFREGSNNFNSFRYIDAFFSFYYILEGLYGNGKSKNSAIEKEFLKSPEFSKSVKWFIETLKNEKKHLENINRNLKLRNKILNVEGIIHLLVSTRGDLHHFTNNSKKKQNTPFNHNEFESISWMSLGLGVKAILDKTLEINLKDANK